MQSGERLLPRNNSILHSTVQYRDYSAISAVDYSAVCSLCVCVCGVCVSVCECTVCVCVRVCVTVRGGESLFASVWRRSPNAVQYTVLESNAVQYTVLERRHFPRASLGIKHDGCTV